jgi:hypothetical protein
MAYSYGSVTVTTAATLIVPANPNRKSVTVVNSSDATLMYIGPDSSITTANAQPLYENQTRDQEHISETWQGDIYGIVGSGTADARYWEVD